MARPNQYGYGMVRQFFEETKEPILYIHLPLLNGWQAGPGAGSTFRSIGYGAYYVLGRMNDLPLSTHRNPTTLLCRGRRNRSEFSPLSLRRVALLAAMNLTRNITGASLWSLF